jgi:hypothetical protein
MGTDSGSDWLKPAANFTDKTDKTGYVSFVSSTLDTIQDFPCDLSAG